MPAVLNMKIRAQVGMRGEESTGPTLFVDDRELSWEELGEILQTYEGWGLHIQITEN